MFWRNIAVVSVVASLLAVSVPPAFAGGEPAPWRMGIWKSSPPPKNPDGQFGNQDPFALAHGEHIHTDCSIFWIDPNSNKLYCFNSGTSKEFFAANPAQYLKSAHAVWNAEKQDVGSHEKQR